MLVNLVISLHRAVLLTAIAIALVATGFAHRLPGPQDEALAFSLQNGVSLSEICGDEAGKGANAGVACEACRITAASDVPLRSALLIDLELAFLASGFAPIDIQTKPRALGNAYFPQGPPAA